jgi:AraC-like DNA-binding protein
MRGRAGHEMATWGTQRANSTGRPRLGMGAGLAQKGQRMRQDLTILGAWTRRVVEGLEGLGLDVRGICADTGLDYAALRDPDARVLRDHAGLLWQEAARRSGDRDLGLHAGEKFQPAATTVLAHLVMSSANLLEAAGKVARLQRLVAHAAVLSVEERSDGVALVLTPQSGDLDITRQEMEFMATFLARFGAFVAAGGFALLRVDFAHPYPGDATEHERIFGCPVYFGSAETSLLFPWEVMRRPSPHFSAEVARQLESVAEDYVGQLADPGVGGRVRGALRSRLGREPCGVEALAADLHMSPRTLQRSLGRENTRFSEILDDVRKERCIELIDAGTAPSLVADRAGFADLRAFRRAFKRWTGCTPSEYPARG